MSSAYEVKFLHFKESLIIRDLCGTRVEIISTSSCPLALG